MLEITRVQLAAAAVVVAVAAWFGARALAPRASVGGNVAAGGAAGGAAAGGAAAGGAEAGAQGEPGVGGAAGAGGDAATGSVSAASDGGGTAVTLSRPAGEVVVVHVAGAVRRPGLYRMKEGDRVGDAVDRAGGAARGADLDAVNLAAEVKDGVQILVPPRAPRAATAAGAGGATAGGGGVAAGTGGAAAGGAGTGGGGVTAGGGAAGVIDLNRATEAELETLDGVGPATAAKILQWRTEHGPFRSVDDLEQVPGIGPKKLAAMRPRVRV